MPAFLSLKSAGSVVHFVSVSTSLSSKRTYLRALSRHSADILPGFFQAFSSMSM